MRGVARFLGFPRTAYTGELRWLRCLIIRLIDSTARSFLTDGEGGVGLPVQSTYRCPLAENYPQSIVLPIDVNPLAPEQEQLRILLISSPSWVRETIHDLHRCGFANASNWSSLQPGTNPDEVVSILTRRRQRSQES